MKLLEDIPTFPRDMRKVLVSRYGIETAEAFFAHAVRDPEGLRIALGVQPDRIDQLAAMVEGYLPLDYIGRCRRPAVRHPRGLLTD